MGLRRKESQGESFPAILLDYALTPGIKDGRLRDWRERTGKTLGVCDELRQGPIEHFRRWRFIQDRETDFAPGQLGAESGDLFPRSDVRSLFHGGRTPRSSDDSTATSTLRVVLHGNRAGRVSRCLSYQDLAGLASQGRTVGRYLCVSLSLWRFLNCSAFRRFH